MLYREIVKLLGLYLLAFSLFLLIPLGLSAFYEFFDTPEHHPQPHATLYFFYTLLTTWGLGALFLFWGRGASTSFFRREGIAAVVLIWLITPALSALPFVWSGTVTNFYQAYFEMASGYTTTGSSVLQAKNYDKLTGEEIPLRVIINGVHETEYIFWGNIEPVRDVATGKIIAEGIEAVSKGLLFWRSFTQWLGGLGVVVLFVAILPALGVGGKVLFHAEMAGPIKEGITPRIKETAMHLWKIYLGLTVLQIAALMLTNSSMEWLDAFTITFSTLATGGFSIKNQSIASYENFATERVVMLFMFLGACNFSLYYYLIKGKFYKLYDPELLLFIVTLLIGSVWVSLTLVGTEQMNLMGEWTHNFTISESFRYGVFQMISGQTSTGFATTNYDIWPYLPQVLLLVVMFLGGMSGSTAGGIKIARILILFKVAQNKVEALFRPKSIRSIKISGKEIDYSVAMMVFIYFLLLMFVSVTGVIIFVAEGCDPETSIGMVACCINNIGMAFRVASPLNSFAFLSDMGLMVASLIMIMGRLEFFAFFAVLIPSFWTQDS